MVSGAKGTKVVYTTQGTTAAVATNLAKPVIGALARKMISCLF
jgi:hypothetical protein